MSSAKSIVDNIAGGATTAAFAIPEAGPIIAGVLAVGKSLFDMFYPPDKVDPKLEAVNVTQFKNAMTDMKVFISEEMTTHDRKERLSHGITYLQTYWDYVNHPEKMSPTLISMHGDYTAEDIAQWKADLATFAAPLNNDDDPFIDTLNWLDLTPKNRSANLDMYMYFINLFMNYTKYFKKSKHPGTEGPKPVLPEKPVFPASDYGRNGKYGKLMLDRIKPFIDNVRPAVEQAHKDWNAREAAVAKGLASIAIGHRKKTAPSNGLRQFLTLGIADTDYDLVYWVHVPKGTPGSNKDGNIAHSDWIDDDGYGAKKALPGIKDKYKAYAMKELGKKYQLQNLTLDDLNKYPEIIKTWDRAIADMDTPPIASTALAPPPPEMPPSGLGEGGMLWWHRTHQHNTA